MQKLALMMAVMMLGMSPVNGCDTSVDSGNQGVGGQVEMMPPSSAWFSDGREALATEKRVNSATLERKPTCGARRVFGQANPATSSAGDRRPGEDKERGPDDRAGSSKEELRRQGI
jgi:hypothetical protein